MTELTLKRHSLSSAYRGRFGGFFISGGETVNLFVYSDESGVLDKTHNEKFVFGGLIFLDKESKDECIRKYREAEKAIYTSGAVDRDKEVKASAVSNKNKNKLYRALNEYYKFGVVVSQKNMLDSIFDNKKTKQRYLDYAYKIGVKYALAKMIENGLFLASDVENIYFFVDEHTTATNGRYELREALEQELKFGTYNYHWNIFYEPLFPKMRCVNLKFCNSASKVLVRAADIVANKIYYISLNNNDYSYEIEHRHMNIKYLP
jgi:hypothetical protein